MYKTFSDQRFVGRYEFINPSVVIRDIELIKKITVKDFDHFIDHRDFTDEVIEPLLGRNLFSLRGQEWKEMRTFLSPAFTSSKIKLMVSFIQEVGDQMVTELKKKLKDSKAPYVDVDCKDLTARSTTDAIASCAFGFKVDSHKEPENQFFIRTKDTTTFGFRQFMLFFAYAAFPTFFKKINMTLLSKETSTFFIDLVINTMKDREARNIVRPDMIHLLIEAKKGSLKNADKITDHNKESDFAAVEETSLMDKTVERAWSDLDLVAQAAIFLIAGFETVSTAVTFALYELAINQDVQEQLFQEIKEFDEKHEGKLDLNIIQNMQYMDMVISEVLRMWPPITTLDRVCVKDYNLGKPHCDAPNDFIIRKGEVTLIPVWSLHHDHKYFQDPEKFKPERFSKENRHLINPLTYLPFGVGPRNCIGSRFALCEVKILLFYIIKHVQVLPTEMTIHPTKLSGHSLHLKLKEGHWLRFKSRG